MHINSFRLILISSTCGTGLAYTYVVYMCTLRDTGFDRTPGMELDEMLQRYAHTLTHTLTHTASRYLLTKL